MNRTIRWLLIGWAVLIFARSAQATVAIAWTEIANPGNPSNPATDNETNFGGPFGSVPYAFEIGTYDVTNKQYVAFLNAKDPTGANQLGLFDNTGYGYSTYGGIGFNPAAPSGTKYTVLGNFGNRPVNYVNWLDAIRFANWLNNGQGDGDTETGSYTLLGGTPIPTNAATITRNPGAVVVLPNLNEWHKAAYYDPATSSYFKYPTSSNIAPTAIYPVATPNSANYANTYATLTDVGAYTGTTSPYGVYDMAGNVMQLNEVHSATGASLNGGAYDRSAIWFVATGVSGVQGLSSTSAQIGFRVARVPEPSTMLLLATAGIGYLTWRLRRQWQT